MKRRFVAVFCLLFSIERRVNFMNRSAFFILFSEDSFPLGINDDFFQTPCFRTHGVVVVTGEFEMVVSGVDHALG